VAINRSGADREQTSTRFAEQAGGRRSGALIELWGFLRSNKRWWLTPIVLVMLVFGVLVLLGGTAVAPFIYTLF
jgi:hypothetical protein